MFISVIIEQIEVENRFITKPHFFKQLNCKVQRMSSTPFRCGGVKYFNNGFRFLKMQPISNYEVSNENFNNGVTRQW